MKRVLVVNRFKTNNLGDFYLGKGLCDTISDLRVEPVRAELTVNKYARKLIKRIKSLGIKLYVAKIIVALYYHVLVVKNGKFDGIVVGGGQLLLDNGFFLQFCHAWVDVAIKRKIKIAFYGVGLEALEGSKFNVNQKYGFLRKASYVGVREKHSMAVLHEYLACTLVPDAAYGLNIDEEQAADIAIKKAYGENYCAVFIADISSALRYKAVKSEEAYVMQLIAELKNISSNLPIVLSYSADQDFYDLDKIHNIINQEFPDRSVIFDGKSTLGHRLNIIRYSKFVISSRLHPLIIGQIFSSAPRPIIRNKKMQYFCEMYFGNELAKQGRSEALNSVRGMFEAMSVS